MSTIAIDARIISTSTGRYVERLITRLQDIDPENEYLILVRAKDKDYWQPKQSNFRIVIADFADFSIFGEQIQLLQLLNQLKPDLVHFCMPQQPMLYRGKKVTTIHDLTPIRTYNSDKNWLLYHLKQLVARGVLWLLPRTNDRIIVPTIYVKHDLMKFAGVNDRKITQLYEAAELTTTKTSVYSPLHHKQFIMYAGQQSDYKNIRRLMLAHQKLLTQKPDLILALVGRLSGKNGVPLQRNKTWAESQGFKNILYTDFLPDEQLAWLYQHTACYVFPSLMEGFGLPALEAMLQGAPVASSNATCLPEVYGEAAHYFEPTEVDDIARAVSEVLDDEKLRASLIKKGKKQAQRYSWRTMAEETLVIYRHVLNT